MTSNLPQAPYSGRTPSRGRLLSRPGASLALIVLFAAALYLASNGRVGLWDRDEPRYAQTSKQMLQSDPPDWVVPHLLDKVRTAKPVFIYWCQAGAMRLLGGPSDFAARFPSAIAMVLTLILLSVVLKRYIGAQRAIWTILIFATTALVIAAAKMCITDSVLLLWITIAQLCLFAIYRGSRSWLVAIIMWCAIGLAGLTKGPVVLGVQFATMLVLVAFDVGKNWRSGRDWKEAIRWWGRTRPLVGIVIVAAIVGPWLAAIQLKQPDFLRKTLWHDVFGRSIKPLEGHKGPPGFYLLTIWGTFLPWCLLLPTAFTIGWKHRRVPAIRFALAAAIGPWVMFECVQTKLVHYLLPAYPALAFLTADAIVRCIRGQHDDLRRPIAVVVTGIWAGAIMLLGVAPWIGAVYFRPLPTILYVAMAAITIVGIIYASTVFVLFRSRRFRAAFDIMGAGMALIIAMVWILYLPNAQFLWLPERVADCLIADGATVKGQVVMIDYKEDSLAYYQGGTIREYPQEMLISAEEADLPRWVVMTRELWLDMPFAIHCGYDELGSFKGIAYAARGRILDVVVLRKR